VNDLPILDGERLLLITRGSSALADEFLEALASEAAELLDRAQHLTGSGDRVVVNDIGHTLKGMAAEVGAPRLRAAAAALEGETDPARWPDRLAQLHGALAELHHHHQAVAKP
jgi:HPt (histidine-containing phosphotransfer) domain-containing protein